jgi:hypothetical protein
MRPTLPIIVVLLACGIARASEGVCEEPDKDPRLTFESDPYIITEINDPEFVALGSALTYTTKRYNVPCGNGCADLSWHNAESLAEDWLYDKVKTTNGEVMGWECGGGATCKEPLRAHNVQCTVKVGDCDYFEDDPEKSPYTYFRVKRIFSLECLGDISCTYEGRPVTDCCIIISTKTIGSG